MSGVVFASFKAVFTEVKVIAVSALEPGTIDREHLASVTPKNKTRLLHYMTKTLRCAYNHHVGIAAYKLKTDELNSKMTALKIWKVQNT